ncbi:hypothetical protein BU16DRAFT_280512 [Lophium mytilinum]|uniref:Uncharacterized protein n=1 Tax=Lophium mytilinum TaxID=390894 RepID=A0A6A6R8E4_9PEZI|nr:hypothetical protein BU16DRAFT_280512 [Lophium mytilinum]
MHLRCLSNSKPLSILFATTILLNTIFADHGRHPIVTPAALLAPKRQAETCVEATDTLCADGLGCCPMGEPCTYTSVTIPICAGSCNAASVFCEGAYSNVCCEAGSSCDYASSGLCTAGLFQFSSFSAAPSIAVPSLTVPSIIVPSLTVPSFSYPSLSLPSVPSFTPFAPTATEQFTASPKTPDETVETTVGETTGTASESAAIAPTKAYTGGDDSTSTVVVQSTGVAPDGPRGLGKGLLEVLVGGIGLLIGL